MLMVKTKVKKSTIPDAGLGLFADEFIKKGTMTWRFCPGFDQILYEDDMLRLSEPARKEFLKHNYKSLEGDYYVSCGDDERFINHSENPNIVEDDSTNSSEPFSIASRDINPGEELFCNYYDFDANADMKLNNDFDYKPNKLIRSR
ncbi:MAG: SET domain-containing protein [Candidatus Paceibacterota bacterium]